MTRHYLLALEGKSETGSIEKGNLDCTFAAPITSESLEEAKGKWCDALLKRGVKMNPDNLMITAAIPLDV